MCAKEFLSFDNGFNTRRNTSIPFIEPKCKTEMSLRHSSGFGPRLYRPNNFIKKNPDLKTFNNKLFKKKILEQILN